MCSFFFVINKRKLSSVGNTDREKNLINKNDMELNIWLGEKFPAIHIWNLMTRT